METLRLIKNDFGHYKQAVSDSQAPSLDIIHNILDHSGINFDFLFEWLANSRFSTFRKNNYTFIKLSNKVIISSCPLPGENLIESKSVGAYLDISYGKLVLLIDKFKQIRHQKPSEIIVTHCQGDICIECKA